MINLARQYFKDHNLSEEFVKDEGWKWDEEKICIPIRDKNGIEVFIKERRLRGEPKYWMPPGTHATLFNYWAVTARSYVIISEGEMDCTRLKQDDTPAVSSTGGSGTFLKEWVELLKNHTVFICLDNDAAGRKGTAKLLELMPEARVVTLPAEGKDICEFFAAGHSRADFIGLLQAAQTKGGWLMENKPEDYKLLSAKDLSKRDFPLQQWLIKDVIYMEGFCFIYGPEGVGKSFIALSIAQALATGQKWLDRFDVPRSAKTLFIDKENPLPILAKRIVGMGIVGENIFWLERPEKLALVENGQPTKFSNSLYEDVIELGIDLIIVDSFVDLMAGNENSAEETQKFFDAMRTIFPHKAILILHHEGKPIKGDGRSEAQRTRGSTNINAQTMTQFRLEQVARSKTEMTINQTKARDTLRLDKFMVRMVVEENVDQSTTVTGFEYLGVVKDAGADEKSEKIRGFFADAFQESEVIARAQMIDICMGAGISSEYLDKVVKNMVKSKEISKEKVGHNIYYRTLASVKTEDDFEAN